MRARNSRRSASFFRIVQSNPPTVRDFESDWARGRPRPWDPELARLWDGISVFATEMQASRKARDYPMLGDFISRLEVPEGAVGIRAERTLPRSRGHHTLWGAAEALLALVVETRPAG